MARARNIKPGTFVNDTLAENEPLGRLLFIGMWTIADYKGDFEWREKRVKAQLLPYDNCNITKLAINLDESGFIRFYSVHDKIYCRVVEFCAHQNPHKNEKEKGSDIPNFDEESRQVIDFNTLTINRDKSRLKRNDSHTDRADSFNLIPDSLPPNPETGSMIPDTLDAYDAMNQKPFERFWEAYGKKEKRAACEKKWNSKKLDPMIDHLLADIANRSANCRKWRTENGIQQFKSGPLPYINGELWNDAIQPYPLGGQQMTKQEKEKQESDEWAEFEKQHGKSNDLDGEFREIN